MEVRSLLSLFQYDFMQRALLAMVAMSLFSPILGVFLILRRQSLMSDTLSHVSLSGLLLASSLVSLQLFLQSLWSS